MANMKARRKLSDLYKRGVEIRFGPGPDDRPVGKIAPGGEGNFLTEDGLPLPLGRDDVQIWVRAPSPLQREMSMRDAQASRARSLIRAKRNEDSEEHLTIMAFLADMSYETLLDYVITSEQDTQRNEALREVLAEDEWSEMSAYQDALRQFEEMDPEQLEDNEEYQAFQELDQKFGDQVAAREAEIRKSTVEAYSMRDRKWLEKKALDKRSDLIGSQAFMEEYERQMLFYSVRDFDEPDQLFYGSARELAEADDDIRSVIQAAMAPFIADAGEAKNSPGVVSGSESSELPSEPETSAPSTPEAVNA